jgi:hypothetical protein
MNYCVEEKGMNQPLTIPSDKVTSDQLFDQTTPTNGDINPTTTTPGLDFPSTKPTINVTLDQPAALTVIYVPTDRPNQPTNVDEFTVTFVYPNGTTSGSFTSKPPSTTGTTTTPSPPTKSGVVPPSSNSPQVDLPPNFEVPEGTKVVITITSTDDNKPPTGVCTIYFVNDNIRTARICVNLIWAGGPSCKHLYILKCSRLPVCNCLLMKIS